MFDDKSPADFGYVCPHCNNGKTEKDSECMNCDGHGWIQTEFPSHEDTEWNTTQSN